MLRMALGGSRLRDVGSESSSSIEELALLDTIPAPAGEDELAKSRIKYLTVAPMFAEAIERTYQEISIAKLFN